MVSRVFRSAAKLTLAAVLLGVAAGPAFAADATLKQVYDEAKSGDIDGALTMMGPVLKDHPNSAKAHYVEAELLARDHRLGEARGELTKAQSLAPGLPGISSHSVQELEVKLNAPAASTTVIREQPGAQPGVAQSSGISWGLIAIIGLVILAILALMRRRSAPAYAPGYGAAGVPPASGSGGPGYGPGYGPTGYGGGMGMGMGGGMGQGGGLLGGLAQGAAMGAGFAAGEEVIDHMFRGERGGGEGRSVGADSYGEGSRAVDPDADMGGNDFGVSDSGSWDDSSSGGSDGDGW